MNKAYKYTLTANEHKEITFGVGVNRLAISNANGYDGDVTIITREITKTKSGDIVSFDDGADAPFADLTVNIVPNQSGWGDPSSSNNKPFNGYNGCGIANSKNDIYDSTGTTVQSPTSEKHVDIINKKSIKVYTTGTGAVHYTSSRQELSNYALTAGKTYAIYANVSEISNKAKPLIAIRNFTNSIVKSVYVQNIGYYGFTFTYDPSIHQYLSFFATWDTDVLASVTYDDITFKEIDESISWEETAGTVYGGQIKPLAGELTVTHGYIASYNGETINEPWISSMDVYSAGATPTTGAQVVYPLTTPVTYQLTPTEIRSLLGVNNVWADCGNVSLKYFVQSTQPLFDYINDEDDKCIYIDCEQTGLDTYSITSSITKAEFVSLLNENKNVKLRLDTGSGDVIFDLSYVTATIADFTCNRTALISDVNSFQSLTLRVDMSGDTLSLSRGGIITIGDGSYEYITGQNNQLIKDGWSWSTQGYDLRDADELLFMITPGVNVASDSDTINGEMQRSSNDPKRALFCKGIKNMLPDVQEIESPFWFNDIVVVGNRGTYTSKNDITMKIRVWANHYNISEPSLADINFYANCDCSDSTANLWPMCNVFVFKKKR